MLEKLALKDTQWRNIAYSICKDRMLSDDLTQEMYLRLMHIEKEINDFYIILTIKNLYIDHLKQQSKTIPLDKLDFSFETKINDFSLTDREREILNDFNNLKFYEREIIELASEKSLRKIAKEYNLHYAFVFRTKRDAINKITNGKNKETK
jgi:RNA polymerase sigma factor (sigma-70 family)